MTNCVTYFYINQEIENITNKKSSEQLEFQDVQNLKYTGIETPIVLFVYILPFLKTILHN
jgi:hypothetical protein